MNTHQKPHRVQRQRTPGWRMPANTVYVGRPTKWGNPYSWSAYPAGRGDAERRRAAVQDFLLGLINRPARRAAYPSDAEIRAELAGKNLACWCPLDQPCHADVLLDIANRPAGDRTAS